MVSRKPLPENAIINPSIAPQVHLQDVRQELWSASEPEASAERPWEDPTKPAKSTQEQRDGNAGPEQAPGTLKEGFQGDYSTIEEEEENAWSGENRRLHPEATGQSDMSRTSGSVGPEAPASGTETNPFKRKASQSGGHDGVTVQPTNAEIAPPLPTEPFSKLNLNEPSNNPWQPALDGQKKSAAPTAFSNISDQESGRYIWTSQEPSRAPSTAPQASSPALESLPSEGSGGWNEDPLPKATSPLPQSPLPTLEDVELKEESHVWDDLATMDKGKTPMKAPPAPTPSGDGASTDGWNLVDEEPIPGPSATSQSQEDASQAAGEVEEVPELPPRSSGKPPTRPPRPEVSGKTETYQVKNINWFDATAAKNPRSSPILVQNANGPCPLVALVNALSLTTPANIQETNLVNTLKTREQVSLDYLLNAVLDELMSERRMGPDEALPDITELYEFLKGLHTGMNVNPRFLPTKETVTAFKRTSLTHLHPAERDAMIPGTFEDTKEMSFYRAFSIPLIHGWIPPQSEPVYDALARRAESYEDAQNLLFREEELEEKLSSPSSEGLSGEEQALYQDIVVIKSFLCTSATQLTAWGLEVITQAMKPGSVAILFRNDHFSTLYRHPQTLQLLTLVTDAGYASHDEIVWESLVDVNGERAEFFSGDFLVVGGASQQQLDESAVVKPSSQNGRGEWTTVHHRRGKRQGHSQESPPMSPKEQEDRDLALALQLQEEEEERHRSAEAQRRRESQLSEQYIEQQHSNVRQGPPGLRRGDGPVQVTGRRTSGATAAQPVTVYNGSIRGRGAGSVGPTRGGAQRPAHQQVRSLVPPVARNQGVNRPAEGGDDDAPPSYEQAAKESPYIPPHGHPSHPASSPSSSVSQVAAGPTTPSSSASRLPGGLVMRAGNQNQEGPRRGSVFRQGVPPAAAGSSGGGKDRDCILM